MSRPTRRYAPPQGRYTQHRTMPGRVPPAYRMPQGAMRPQPMPGYGYPGVRPGSYPMAMTQPRPRRGMSPQRGMPHGMMVARPQMVSPPPYQERAMSPPPLLNQASKAGVQWQWEDSAAPAIQKPIPVQPRVASPVPQGLVMMPAPGAAPATARQMADAQKYFYSYHPGMAGQWQDYAQRGHFTTTMVPQYMKDPRWNAYYSQFANNAVAMETKSLPPNTQQQAAPIKKQQPQVIHLVSGPNAGTKAKVEKKKAQKVVQNNWVAVGETVSNGGTTKSQKDDSLGLVFWPVVQSDNAKASVKSKKSVSSRKTGEFEEKADQLDFGPEDTLYEDEFIEQSFDQIIRVHDEPPSQPEPPKPPVEPKFPVMPPIMSASEDEPVETQYDKLYAHPSKVKGQDKVPTGSRSRSPPPQGSSSNWQLRSPSTPGNPPVPPKFQADLDDYYADSGNRKGPEGANHQSQRSVDSLRQIQTEAPYWAKMDDDVPPLSPAPGRPRNLDIPPPPPPTATIPQHPPRKMEEPPYQTRFPRHQQAPPPKTDYFPEEKIYAFRKGPAAPAPAPAPPAPPPPPPPLPQEDDNKQRRPKLSEIFGELKTAVNDREEAKVNGQAPVSRQFSKERTPSASTNPASPASFDDVMSELKSRFMDYKPKILADMPDPYQSWSGRQAPKENQARNAQTERMYSPPEPRKWERPPSTAQAATNGVRRNRPSTIEEEPNPDYDQSTSDLPQWQNQPRNQQYSSRRSQDIYQYGPGGSDIASHPDSRRGDDRRRDDRHGDDRRHNKDQRSKHSRDGRSRNSRY